jgi:hypothetical protein
MTHTSSPPAADRSSRPPRIAAWQAIVCCLAAVLIGIAAGRIAAWAEHVRAPLVVFPLAVGCAVGLAWLAVARLTEVVHRPTLVAGAAVAALATIAGQHYFPYRDYLHDRAAFLAEKSQDSLPAMFLEGLPDAAPGFAHYMRGQADLGRPIGSITLRGAAAWASWALDGVLVLASAVAIVIIFSRRAKSLEL